MDFEGEIISDPLISATGKIYSAAGLKRLLTELCPKRVDNRMLLCRGTTRRDNDHGWKQQQSGKQR